MMGFPGMAWIMSFITIFTPVWGLMLWYIPIKNKWMYPISAIAMYIPTVLLSYSSLTLKGVTPGLHLYGLFFIFYMAIFGLKLNWTNWNKAASIALFALFIAGEWWELPVFLYDYLGKIGILENKWTRSILDMQWIYSHMRRIYTLTSCYLLSTLCKVKMTHTGWLLLIAGSLICLLLILPLGLGYRSLPPILVTLARITSLSFMGIIIMEGLDVT